MKTPTLLNDIRRQISQGYTATASVELADWLHRQKNYADLFAPPANLDTIQQQILEGTLSAREAVTERRVIHQHLIEMIREIERKQSLRAPVQAAAHQVRVFCYACDFDPGDLQQLLTQQNQHQQLFGFEIIPWETWPKRHPFEQETHRLTTPSRLLFVDHIIQRVRQHLAWQAEPGAIDLVITSLLLPKQSYSWNNISRDGIVVSRGRLQQLFSGKGDQLDQVVLRVVQRMLIYALHLPGLVVHEATRGCLFDQAVDIRPLAHGEGISYLCRECEAVMSRTETGRSALQHINDRGDNLILHDPN